MTRAGQLSRAIYIRQKGTWIRIGTLWKDGEVKLYKNVYTILEEVFEE